MKPNFPKVPGIRSYYNRVHKYNKVPVPALYKYGMTACLVVATSFFTYTTLFVRPEWHRITDATMAYVDPAWVEYWLKLRNQKRLEVAVEKAILEESPEVAADKVLEWARTAARNSILEDLKILQPALPDSTVAEFQS